MEELRWAISRLGCLEGRRHLRASFRAGWEAETSGADNLRSVALVEASCASADAARPLVPESMTEVA